MGALLFPSLCWSTGGMPAPEADLPVDYCGGPARKTELTASPPCAAGITTNAKRGGPRR